MLYRNKAFTLVELMMVLAIVLAVLFVALPYGQSLLNKNTLEDRINTISHAVKYAKNMAKIKGEPLLLSELSDKTGWSQGMKLLIADDANHPQGTLIQQWQWRDSPFKVSWHGFNSDHHLRFADDIRSSAMSGTFTISDGHHQHAKIIISRLGRLRVERS